MSDRSPSTDPPTKDSLGADQQIVSGPSTIGVRELRNQVAAVLRRAQSGDRIVVTVDGKPVAQLAPLAPTATVTLHDLASGGLIEPPGRKDKPTAPDAAFLPVDVSADRVIEEIRG